MLYFDCYVDENVADTDSAAWFLPDSLADELMVYKALMRR